MSSTQLFDVFGNRVNPGQYFFGGAPSAPKPQKAPQIPPTPQLTIPKTPAPVKTPPPPTVSNLDSQQAAQDQKTQAARRKGIRSTLIAGESPMSPATGQAKTLLG